MLELIDISTYEKRYNYSLHRYSSILHTRLRFNCCALNYYHFMINCTTSPACDCGANYESVNHCLLFCPRYAAHRSSLLLAVAEIFGDSSYHMSDSVKAKILLFRSDKLTLNQNNKEFYLRVKLKQTYRQNIRDLPTNHIKNLMFYSRMKYLTF